MGEKVKTGDALVNDKQYSNSVDLQQVSGVQLPQRLDPDERQWGKHCHDTPGTVCQDQIINMLTAEEVSRVLATRPVQPRTFLLKQGETVMLGGLARLDMLDNADERHHTRHCLLLLRSSYQHCPHCWS